MNHTWTVVAKVGGVVIVAVVLILGIEMLLTPAVVAVERDLRRMELAAVSGSYTAAAAVSYEAAGDSFTLWPLLDDGERAPAVIVMVEEIGYRSRLRLLVAVNRRLEITAFSIPQRFESPSVERVFARPATSARMARGEIHGLSGATITAEAIDRALGRARSVAGAYFREAP
ncbi:MAG: FMN-binding protein, partial [Spirochaetales bacterium]|nr:FMN-binding protein [Spirochaetales bacterium]